MNDGLGFRKVFDKQGMFWGYEHDRILLVKPLYRIVAPNPGPNWINCFISVNFEQLDPVRQILRVYVVCAGRPRRGC
jgi:hypothetical protein